MAGHLGLTGKFWNWIADLSTQFGTLGYVSIGLFSMSWAVSFIVYRAGGYHRDERRA
jgi:high-affinity nickel-transport protein